MVALQMIAMVRRGSDNVITVRAQGVRKHQVPKRQMLKRYEQRILKRGNKALKLGQMLTLTRSQSTANQNNEITFFWSTKL